MHNTKGTSKLKTPLVSLEWLTYVGIVLVVLVLYVLGTFYYHYANDIFPKSLSVGQYARLSLLSIGSQGSFILFSLLFFSGGLVYRSVRQNKQNPLHSLKRDLLVLALLGGVIWTYGAFFETSVRGKFHAMIFDTQQLESGEKLDPDSQTNEHLRESNLSELYVKIDTLDHQIEYAEERFIDQLAVLIPPNNLEEIIEKIDFGSSSIDVNDVRNSSYKWDGKDRPLEFFINNSAMRVRYIESLKNQQDLLREETKVMHFTPIYILLFAIFGMLLGYLIPFHKAALTAILFITGYAWYFSAGVIEAFFGMTFSNQSSFILGKVGVLVIFNIGLVILAQRAYKRSVSSV